MKPDDWVEIRKGTASVDVAQVVEATDERCVLEVDGLGRREYRKGDGSRPGPSGGPASQVWHEASGRPCELEVITPEEIRRRQRSGEPKAWARR